MSIFRIASLFSIIIFSFLVKKPNHINQYKKDKKDGPNIVLIMADDQGYRDVGYMGHPNLQTPELDEMASNGLTFTRFYAAAPVCTPTRGSVLTGRHPNRYGAFNWGHTLRPQELTLAEALSQAGYETSHFGKWHLGPMVAGEPASPGESGFDHWISAYNFYDNDPFLSNNGTPKKYKGESSGVTMRLALEWIYENKKEPFLSVIWFSNPHSPYEAKINRNSYSEDISQERMKYFAEIKGIDDAVGLLRKRLREWGIEKETILWYTSDNGGDAPFADNGIFRGSKGSLWEGGLRVPAIIEWPGHVAPRSTDIPAVTSDIYPTVLDISNVTSKNQIHPLDGESLVKIINQKAKSRDPIGFWEYPKEGRRTPNNIFMKKLRKEIIFEKHEKVRAPVLHRATDEYPKSDDLTGWAVWIRGKWKLHKHSKPLQQRESGLYSLYNLNKDPKEKNNLIQEKGELGAKMKRNLLKWQNSVVKSLKGEDY